MKLEIARLLAQAAEDNGLEAVTLRESYSGRGMYGQSTAAVVADTMGELLAVVALAGGNVADTDCPVSAEDLAEAMLAMRTDNMGHGIVVY